MRTLRLQLAGMSKQQQQAAETNERRRAELEQRANELAAREAALDGA